MNTGAPVRNLRTMLAGVCGLVLAFSIPTLTFATPPVAERRPVTDEYHGVKVADDYRWLEDWSDPSVKSWSEGQNLHARAVLDAMNSRAPLRDRIEQVENAVGVEYHAVKFASGTYFAMKSQPPKQQAMLVTLTSLEDVSSSKVLVDPNQIDPSGGTTIDWFFPSPDGTNVAVSMSSGGSESGDVYVFDVATGKELEGDRVPRVNGGTAGGWLAWAGDGSGFYYTRYPRAGERPDADMNFYTQLYHHTLDTPADKDRYETGKDYPKIAEIVVEVSPDGKWALTHVQNGDGGEFLQELRKPDGSWIRLTTWEDRVVEATFGQDNAVYLVSRKDAPMGKVLRLDLGGEIALSAAKQIVPERADGSIETDFFARTGVYPARSRLYVQYQVGGPNELRVFDLAGTPLGVVPALPVSTITSVERVGGDDIIFENDSYVTPSAYFRLAVAEGGDKGAGIGSIKPTAIRVPEPPGMPRMEVRREFATSRDGTKVPVNIIARAEFFEHIEEFAPLLKDVRELEKAVRAVGGVFKSKGSSIEIVARAPRAAGFEKLFLWPAPTIVYGYGGYGNNLTPGFSRRRMLWVEQGGVYVVANIRGGGEYGERWHREGNLTNKQNVFDDFVASVNHMVDHGYTTRDKLAINGGSNGGLLMGAVITQHPDVCKAVVSSVGIYDMLRVELSANGEFNITEFGTVKNPDHFRALHAYSPYHRVRDGVKYPAILFTTGANDPRVDPMQSRKMTARLQAANPQGLVLLRTSGNTGHGSGTPLSARIDLGADTYGFMFDQLQADYRPIVPEKGKDW